MEDKYYKYFHYIMIWSYGLKRRSKKKGLNIYQYDGVKVVTLNDFPNRRMLIWFYREDTKEIFRFSMHGFYVRPLRKRITEYVKGIQTDPTFWERVIKSRRSYSYKRERAFKSYMDYKARMNK